MSLLIYFLNALILVGLMMWLRKQSWAGTLQPYFMPALLLKLLCGIILGLIYHHYYGEGDTLTYYKASLKLTDHALNNPGAYARLIFFNEFESEQFRSTIPFSSHPGFSNSFFMLKCVSLLNLLTGSSYYLNTLYFSIFSFWGMAKLTAVLARVYPAAKNAAILAFLFFPTVIFWSSGLLKDAVMMGTMCWTVAFILQLGHGQKVRLLEIVLLPFMLYLFIRVKIFFSAALLLFLGSYLLVKLLIKIKPALQNVWVQLGIYVGILLIAGVAAMQLVSVYRPDFIMEQLVYSYEGMRALSSHVAHIEYPNLQPEFWSLLIHSPEAFLNTVFRPLIGESFALLYLLAGLENLLLMALFVLALVSAISKKHRSLFSLFYLALLFFIVVAAIIIGISTPNFGTLIRYRIIFLPFLVYMLLQSYYVQLLLVKLKMR